MSAGADPQELLSALLDGELDAADEAEVRAWLADHADGRQELDELADVRRQMRELPAVEPPAGFYERLLADGLDDATEPAPAVVTSIDAAPSRRKRRWRRSWAAVAGVGTAAAAAFVLVLGITPVSDRVVPPVNAFAERHDSMTSPSTTAPSSTTSSSSTSSSTTTSIVEPTPTAPPGPADDSYHTIADTAIDSIDPPYVAPAQLDGYARRSAYASGGVVHVIYNHDGVWLSVYEQPGTVDWSRMPANGKTLTVQDRAAWETKVGDQVVLVIDRGPMVLTVVSSAPADDMMRAATSVPPSSEPSMATRMQRGAANLVRSFGTG
jgi:anti-sigma factor RsiW